MYLYLGGSLTYHQRNNQFHKATEWRNKLVEFCRDNHIEYFNPADMYLIEQNHSYNPRMCVDQNRYYLDKSDILIADLNHILDSPGTQWEMCYASEVKKIPIIAFGEECWSPHVMYGVSHLCKDVDEVIELLCNMFKGCIKK